MVEPTIIANMGEGNVGKTESIRMVYDKLCQVAEGKPVHKDPNRENQKDVCAWLMINKVKVGIASDGDTQAIVRDNLNFLTDASCQIILIACRNNHDSVVLLNEYRENINNQNKYNYRIWRTSNARIYEYIDKYNPRVAPKGIQTRFNENWATEIANLIEAWCYA